ncbi:FAD:protein FMN transferase [Patiriisocius sp. Uisw_017]|jgi:thiamine biosynthesis lipoprotein|uniref:FAD:protein FMN transferase n=1 Tax=Patiriisocius sp. Uisw_017 TaxID=3230968 RepID=UPI0039EC50B1
MKFILKIIGLLLIVSCVQKEEITLQVLQGNAFGTTYTIQYYSNSDVVIKRGIDSVINAVNTSVSTYMPESDISKINKGDSAIVVDEIFKDVWEISERVHIASGGFFDPTIGVLRNAYGFGDVKPILNLDKKVLDSLRELVGFNKVKINMNGTIQKKHPMIYFDFNAVAKGYGIDCLGTYLESKQIENYIIELGGEILAKGKNVIKDTYWTAGVESLDAEITEKGKAIIVIALNNSAMAGSGNYRKFRIDPVTGKKYVHTINPLTGLAEQNNMTSAAVIAPTCAVADAFATACMAMGSAAAIEMLKEEGSIEGYLTFLDSDGSAKTYSSPGFKQLVLN